MELRDILEMLDGEIEVLSEVYIPEQPTLAALLAARDYLVKLYDVVETGR